MSDRLFLRRLQGDVKDLDKNRMDFVQAIQDIDNVKLFYFMLRPLDEPYIGGLFMGKIELPADYPKTPGSFYMLTPSGRFNINAKICLTNSSYHKENWTPSWSIRNMIMGVASIFIADDTSGISHIKDTKENRKKMALDSVNFNLTNYHDIFVRFNFYVNPDGTLKTNDEITKIVNEKKVKKEQNQETKTVEESVSEHVQESVVESVVEPVVEPVVESVVEPTPHVVEEKTKKVIKRVVKRVVKKATENDQETKKPVEQPVDPVEEKPKKVIKRVVKRVVKKEEIGETEKVVEVEPEKEPIQDDKPKKKAGRPKKVIE
jgi:ubiquitin-protein ligase